ncbi:MAG: hypothetical protein IPF59_04205 [Ignavibacteria bacterium]|nr:hypothetical protein [Ignavibacteria bacterium]MBK6419527.1 hypothetical protein [Ignavibacteria bacterium]
MILLFIASSHSKAQVEVRSLLKPSERTFRVVLTNGVDTLIAGDDGLVGMYESSRLTYLTVPEPQSNIHSGVSVDSAFYLVETTGDVLVVKNGVVARVRSPERIVGLRPSDSGFLAIGMSAVLRLDQDLRVVEKIALPLSGSLVVADLGKSEAFGVADDSTLYAIGYDGTIDRIERVTETVERVFVADDMVIFTSPYQSYFYSRAQRRLVNLRLEQADIDPVVANNASRMIAAVDEHTNTLLVHLNPILGNTDRSPIFLCDREDTVLRVRFRYQPAQIKNGYAMSDFVASPTGEVLVGDDGTIIERVDTSCRVVMSCHFNPRGTMCRDERGISVLGAMDCGGETGHVVRFLDSAWRIQDVLIRESTIAETNSMASHSAYKDLVVLFAMDSVFVRSVTSDVITKRGRIPNGTSAPVALMTENVLLATSRLEFVRNTQISHDTGVTWRSIKGNTATVGGDGNVYTMYRGTLYRYSVGDTVIFQDSLTVSLRTNEAMLDIVPTKGGVWIFVTDIDQKRSSRINRFICVRDGKVADTCSLVTEIPYRTLHAGVIGEDALFVVASYGGQYWFRPNRETDWTAGSFTPWQIWPRSQNVVGVYGTDKNGRVLLRLLGGSMALLHIDGATSVQDDPNLQWVAIRNAYPNPAERVLNVTISSLPTADYATWRFGLYRLDGSLAVDCKPYTAPWTMNSTVQTVSVPIAGLPQGMYYLASVNRGYAESRQVVVVR